MLVGRLSEREKHASSSEERAPLPPHEIIKIISVVGPLTNDPVTPQINLLANAKACSMCVFHGVAGSEPRV